MNAEIAMYMAQVLNTGAFIALAVWYVVPRLRNLSRASALMALTAVHLGRTLALAVYSSQDAGMKMPNAVRDQIVIGDLAGWALALVILFCLHSRLRLSIALIWLLVIETVLDFGSGTLSYIRAGTIGDLNGAPWLIVAFYVTAVEVAVGLTIWQLITRRGEPLFKAEERR
jgi:NADH:ubiquinone oxidoreductase subunit K